MATSTSSAGAITPNQTNIATEVEITEGSLNGRNIFYLYELNDDHIFQIISQSTFKSAFSLASVCKRFHTLFHTNIPMLMTAKIKQIFAAISARFFGPHTQSQIAEYLVTLDLDKSLFYPKLDPDKTPKPRFVDYYKETKEFLILRLHLPNTRKCKDANIKDLEFEDFPQLMYVKKIMRDFENFVQYKALYHFENLNTISDSLNAISDAMNGIANPQRQDLNRLFIKFFCSVFIGQEHVLKTKSEKQDPAIWNPFNLSIDRLQNLYSLNAQKNVIYLLQHFIGYNLDKKNYDLIIDLIKTLGDHLLSYRLRLDNEVSFFEPLCRRPDLAVAILEYIKNHETELQTNIIHLLESIVIGNGLKIADDLPFFIDSEAIDNNDPDFLEKSELHNEIALCYIDGLISFSQSFLRILTKKAKLKLVDTFYHLIAYELFYYESKVDKIPIFVDLFLKVNSRYSTLKVSIDSFIQKYTRKNGELFLKFLARTLWKNSQCMQDKDGYILLIIAKLSKYIMPLNKNQNYIDLEILKLANNKNIVESLKKQLEYQDVNLDVYARTIANMIIYYNEFESKIKNINTNFQELISEKLLDSYLIESVKNLTDKNASDAFIYYCLSIWIPAPDDITKWDEDLIKDLLFEMTKLISAINDDDLRTFLMSDFVYFIIEILSEDEIEFLKEQLGDHDHARNCLQDALNKYS